MPLLTFPKLQTVAYLGAKVHSDAHTLRDSQAQQNFHAIELPNIPFHLGSVYTACAWLFVGVVGG